MLSLCLELKNLEKIHWVSEHPRLMYRFLESESTSFQIDFHIFIEFIEEECFRNTRE